MLCAESAGQRGRDIDAHARLFLDESLEFGRLERVGIGVFDEPPGVAGDDHDDDDERDDDDCDRQQDEREGGDRRRDPPLEASLNRIEDVGDEKGSEDVLEER